MSIPCPVCQTSNEETARFCASCGTQLVRRCPNCGAEVPPDARFCPSCGTPLGSAELPDAPLEERRLVTIVFADLAGFTEHSDRADPEDVRRILVPFHAAAKEEIERFGGTLDKFIGDAAMGVFGAPMAHEDDPERAVRAALAIRDRVTDGNLPVRIAVHTGEALVTFGEGPQIGERVAGDVVNTTSRLQSFAAEGSVIVGEPTQRATRHVIDYEPLPATRVKGKAEPLVAFVATSVRADLPEREEDDPPPFVGRVHEKELLHDLLERTIGDRTPRLVTVVGEPGIGKSRLEQELHDHLRATHATVGWHRGRCRPFGESITYAALEEIVRSLAGIMPGAPAAEIEARLDARLGLVEPQETDRAWLAARMRPLLGLPVDDDAPVDADETFTAWARFLESAADRSPVVFVAEDLHWADDTLLEFLERLMERAPDVPMLLLCTARPELFARRPTWATGVPHATTISLSPLSDVEMSELLGALLLRSVRSPESSGELVQRAGGNPLYAREFVHMLEDRGDDIGAGAPSADQDGGARVAAASVNVPDTVQALIAARLDALEAGDRRLLQAASVVGDRFWRGALARLDPEAADPETSLRTLQRRGMIRRSSTSAIDGEAEFSFAHALIRDVAYGRLPRPARSHLHRTVTGWLETIDGSGMTAKADLLASHASRALELARAAGLDDELPDLEAEALRFLVAAGERQQSLDAARAAAYYRQAVALAPPGARRAAIRRDATSLGWRSGGMTSEEALEEYEESEREALDAGDRKLAARVLRRLYFQHSLRGETPEAREALERGIAIVEHDPDAREELAELLACRSEAEMFAGHSNESRRWADRALELPHTESITLMALHLRGNARCEIGDMGGVEDLRRALEIAETSGVAIDIVYSYSYLLEWVGLMDGPSAGLPMNRTAVDLCRRRGIEGQGMWTRAEVFWLRFDSGQWDELLDETGDLDAWATAHGDTQLATVADLYRARVLAHRGEVDPALDLVGSLLPVARQIEDLQVLGPALAVAIVAHAAAGDDAEASALAEAFDAATADGPTEYRELYLPEILRALIAGGASDLAHRIVGDRPVFVTRTQLAVASSHALLAEARGAVGTAASGFAETASAWETWGGTFEGAHSLAGLGRSLLALGRLEEAAAATERASAIFETLGVPTARRS